MAYKIANIISSSALSLSLASAFAWTASDVRSLRLFCVLYCFWSFGRSVGRSSAMATSSPYVLTLPVWSLLILPGCSAARLLLFDYRKSCKENGTLWFCAARHGSIPDPERACVVNVFMWTESQLWNGQRQIKYLLLERRYPFDDGVASSASCNRPNKIRLNKWGRRNEFCRHRMRQIKWNSSESAVFILSIFAGNFESS